MPAYFAYSRVSTVRQGQLGVSLQEQRASIERFSERHGLTVSHWFEETETAAKTGRPVFKDLVRRLGCREAQGVILHKIDRGARNLRDWADIGDLIDQGIDVRFAHDDFRLDSRGGRLAADIQAVIATDYIRNLREEVKKGFYGRLRQGLYPLRAPMGYVDRGSGRAKTLHPVYAPLVALAFELYGTGEYSVRTLAETLAEKGLVNGVGKRVSASNLARLLRNPFYTGTIRLPSTGETFLGAHRSIVGRALFDRVQELLSSKRKGTRKAKHAFAYRRFIRCSCGRYLIGELIKGRYRYYRCHACRGISIREERVDAAVIASLPNTCGNLCVADRARDAATEIRFDGSRITLELRPQESSTPRGV